MLQQWHVQGFQEARAQSFAGYGINALQGTNQRNMQNCHSSVHLSWNRKPTAHSVCTIFTVPPSLETALSPPPGFWLAAWPSRPCAAPGFTWAELQSCRCKAML
eukprot:8479965-Heterocapsa_arctica.AAC.1